MCYFVLGPPEILGILNKVEEDREALNKKSKFHIGEIVKVTLCIDKVIKMLIPAYNMTEARMHARELIGSSVRIISVDTLTDDDLNPGTYYTIELDDGRFYVMSEDCLVRRNNYEVR